jgi:hypothetical protein
LRNESFGTSLLVYGCPSYDPVHASIMNSETIYNDFREGLKSYGGKRADDTSRLERENRAEF